VHTTGRPAWASGSGAPPFPRRAEFVDRTPDAVAVNGARAVASSDTAVDPEPEHTALRAALAGWMTPRYASYQLHASIVGPPGAMWTTWMRHRAYVVATTRLSGDDHPPDTATRAARMVLVTERAVGRDGWRGDQQTTVVAVLLERIDGTWRIDSDKSS
jgi:hypothetical protein